MGAVRVQLGPIQDNMAKAPLAQQIQQNAQEAPRAQHVHLAQGMDQINQAAQEQVIETHETEANIIRENPTREEPFRGRRQHREGSDEDQDDSSSEPDPEGEGNRCNRTDGERRLAQ